VSTDQWSGRPGVGASRGGVLSGTRLFRGAWLALACVIVTLVAAGSAQAAVFNVNKTDDPAPSNPLACTGITSCSLREAVIAANAPASGSDTINVPAGTYRLTIAGDDSTAQSGDLDLLDNSGTLTILGAGARSTIIQQTVAGDRVIETHTGTHAISGVTITGGDRSTAMVGTANGGGINIQSTPMTLTNVTVRGNSAGSATLCARGGGIFAAGPLTLVNSTVSGNSAKCGQQGGADGGGIANAGFTVNITNSTISGNVAELGGGISSIGAGATSLLNVTVNGNTAGSGGNVLAAVGTPTTLKNTIVANGTAASGPNCAPPMNSVTSQGNNLEDRNECNFNAAGDKKNTNPLLGALADNGGETDTHALPLGSPAIDAAGGCPPPATDQRGVARPQLAACDMGAFEFRPADVTTTHPPGGGNGGNGGVGPNVTGTGGPGGNGGLCGGGGAGAGGLGAGGGGAGGGGCFGVVVVQSLAAGAVTATAGVATAGTSIRAEVLADMGAAKTRARARRLTLIGQKTARRSSASAESRSRYGCE
jgi:CSLREA domain-containing protein